MALVLSSVVISAIVSAVVSLLMAERRIAAENIIQERKAWRANLHLTALNIHEAICKFDTAKLRTLHADFSLYLNPHDSEDIEILNLISGGGILRANEFIIRVSLLLKHDWERAKWEASLWRMIREREPVRVSYNPFVVGDNHNYNRSRFKRPLLLKFLVILV